MREGSVMEGVECKRCVREGSVEGVIRVGVNVEMGVQVCNKGRGHTVRKAQDRGRTYKTEVGTQDRGRDTRQR